MLLLKRSIVNPAGTAARWGGGSRGRGQLVQRVCAVTSFGKILESQHGGGRDRILGEQD